MAALHPSLAQVVGRGSDLRRTGRKKRLVADSTVEALRAWNDANELEGCPREESFVELYPLLGDQEGQDSVRKANPNHSHCPWLRMDSHACDALPAGIDGVEPGVTCPHNTYVKNSAIFEGRDSVSGTVERLLRLYGAADSRLLKESELDSLTVTELLVTKNELNRQSETRMKREQDKASAQAVNPGQFQVEALRP